MMKKIFFPALVIISALWFFQTQTPPVPDNSSPAQSPHTAVENASRTSQSSDKIIQEAFNNQQNNLQVHGRGVVIKVLPDDLKGSRHQKFILRLKTGQTVLVAHNIDLAPRISRLTAGDTVEFYGEYEWSSKGGVIHWTHDDPKGQHVAGFLKHGGRSYQ